MRIFRLGVIFLAILVSLLSAATGVVRSVEFQKFEGVTVKEIVQRLNDRDIQLVERPYDPQYVETAQQIVEELLAEKGRPGTRVKTAVTELRGGNVKLTFTAVK
jgi:outer membrane protein assembly factor BamA